MNVTSRVSTGLPNAETDIESAPPAYDLVVPSSSGMVRLVTEQLSQIKLSQGAQEEENAVKKLCNYLISEYPETVNIREPISNNQLTDVSHEDYFKRFFLQVTHRSPVLEFEEVNSRDELEQSEDDLTHFYDVDNCVDIKICKTPAVIESVKALVGNYSYPRISVIIDEPMNRQRAWGRHSALLKNDLFIAAKGVDLGNKPHDLVIKLLKEANASTDYSPLFFFRNDSGHNGKLIICTSTDPDPNRKMGLSITSPDTP